MTADGVATPTVSVLLATNVLNAWLDQAVRSILDQGEVDLELVVVHDQIGVDHDRTWTADPRVRCVTTGTSRGVGHALAVGAQVAQGRYLARLDGDDLALPGRLQAQVQHLQAHPEVVLLGTVARTIDELGAVTGRLGMTPAGDVRAVLLTRNVVVHSSVMMRRDAYEASGGYEASLRQMEDYDLWLRLALQGEVHVIQRELTEYRVHGGQLSRRAGSSGTYIDVVIRGRLDLARHLGRSLLLQHLRNTAWRAVQVARGRGWRRPGYERPAASGPVSSS
ncbi:glycosyltransferase [Ornithinimicrobium sp. LYQ103]|uniref:glycosyltransferase n=1 Tax=Ornithinimicrobium sp. LYQ103 TaxID=3378796 RepID=UPI003853720B